MFLQQLYQLKRLP